MLITHTKTTTKPDGNDPQAVHGSDWMAAHTFDPTLVFNDQGGVYALQLSDNGGVVRATGSSAVNYTLPATLPRGFSCGVLQTGAGQVTFLPAAGATLTSFGGATRTGGQHAFVTLVVEANAGGAAAYVLLGDRA